MGTNFYQSGQHIGKRSAAGLYCWDCGVTLCKGGGLAIHAGGSEWHDRCPVCGASRTTEGISEGAAGRELGFNKTEPSPKTGVKTCSSFTWAVDPEGFSPPRRGKPIRDEYGRKYTAKGFDAVLSECPVQFTNLVGEDFS